MLESLSKMKIKDAPPFRPDNPPAVRALVERLKTLRPGEFVTTRWLLENGWITTASLNRYATHPKLSPYRRATKGFLTHWWGGK